MKLGQKIIVIGCPGSGKSTLSKELRDVTGLPLFHLDNMNWKPDKSYISGEEFERELERILLTDKWIIDGNYRRTFEMRFRACDTVIFLDYPVDVCMNGIKERIGKIRTDIPWIEQTLDPELVKMVERYETDNRPVILDLLERYSDVNSFVFRSRLEAAEWMRGLV